MRDQRPGEGAGEHAVGRTAENELSHPRVTIGAHHQQIGFAFDGIGLERVADGPALGVDLLECHLHAVAGKMLAELDAGTRLREALLVDHRDDMDALCRLQ